MRVLHPGCVDPYDPGLATVNGVRYKLVVHGKGAAGIRSHLIVGYGTGFALTDLSVSNSITTIGAETIAAGDGRPSAPARSGRWRCD
jgi:hypothetical protein